VSRPTIIDGGLQGKLGFGTLSTERYISPAVERLEWEHIQRVLTAHDGNVSATARALKMHRRTLQRKLAKRPVRH